MDYNYKYTQDDIITAYYFALIPILSTYNMSPMRIIPPTLLTVNNSYVLYSGVIDTADAICNLKIYKSIIQFFDNSFFKRSLSKERKK